MFPAANGSLRSCYRQVSKALRFFLRVSKSFEHTFHILRRGGVFLDCNERSKLLAPSVHVTCRNLRVYDYVSSQCYHHNVDLRDISLNPSSSLRIKPSHWSLLETTMTDRPENPTNFQPVDRPMAVSSKPKPIFGQPTPLSSPLFNSYSPWTRTRDSSTFDSSSSVSSLPIVNRSGNTKAGPPGLQAINRKHKQEQTEKLTLGESSFMTLTCAARAPWATQIQGDEEKPPERSSFVEEEARGGRIVGGKWHPAQSSLAKPLYDINHQAKGAQDHTEKEQGLPQGVIEKYFPPLRRTKPFHPEKYFPPLNAPTERPQERISAVPLVSTKQSTNAQQSCANCSKNKDITEFDRCARCQSSFYCDRECQKAHWNIHKEECIMPI